MKLRWVWLLLLAAVPVATAADADPQLLFPVDCTLGKDCFIQFYADADMTTGAKDYTCGGLSYDGSKGTHIRLKNFVAMDSGVEVRAAAAGTVLRVRDSMPDVSVTEIDPEKIKDRKAGNGVVIDHGDGWVTQYSHLKRGSITVEPGQKVEAGDRIGEVGLSGNTSFPHIELDVRHDDKPIDPFTGAQVGAGCGIGGHPLWKTDIAYVPTGLLGSGFALGRPQRDSARHGQYRTTELTIQSPALSFWVDLMGLQQHDHLTLKLVGPDGVVMLVSDLMIDEPKPQYFAFTAPTRPPSGWRSGFYIGKLEVLRGDQVIVTASEQIALP
jgi:hypothetical protein